MILRFSRYLYHGDTSIMPLGLIGGENDDMLLGRVCVTGYPCMCSVFFKQDENEILKCFKQLDIIFQSRFGRKKE